MAGRSCALICSATTVPLRTHARRDVIASMKRILHFKKIQLLLDYTYTNIASLSQSSVPPKKKQCIHPISPSAADVSCPLFSQPSRLLSFLIAHQQPRYEPWLLLSVMCGPKTPATAPPQPPCLLRSQILGAPCVTM